MRDPHDDEPSDTEDVETYDSFEEDDEPFEREDFATRKARRLGEVNQQWYDALTAGIFGLGLMVPGVGLCWLAVVALRRGWMDVDQDVVSAAQEPGWFYGTLAFTAAMGLFCAQLGLRMVLHMRRETRRSTRHARRVERAGTRRE